MGKIKGWGKDEGQLGHASAQWQRRRFIRTLSFSTVFSSLAGKCWSSVLAAEVQPLSTSKTGTLWIKISDFPALKSESGSVRLALNPFTRTGPLGTFYPVIINRGPGDVFYALSSRCSHMACVVEPFSTATDRINCLCHGSTYGIDGTRISGPAPSALTKLSASYDGVDTLAVQVPNLSFSLNGKFVVPGPEQARYQLDFTAFRNCTYEVFFRPSVEEGSQVVPFALTAGGALDQTSFTPKTAGALSFFAEAQRQEGFYSVAIKHFQQ